MPLSACDRCQRKFIVEDECSAQRVCPHCLRPMRMTSLEEVAPHLHQPQDAPSLRAPSDSVGGSWMDGAPLVVSEVGRRVLELLSLSQSVCSESVARRQRAGKVRQELARSRREATAALKASRVTLPAEDGADPAKE